MMLRCNRLLVEGDHPSWTIIGQSFIIWNSWNYLCPRSDIWWCCTGSWWWFICSKNCISKRSHTVVIGHQDLSAVVGGWLFSFKFLMPFSFYRAACNADAVWRGEFCLSVCPSVRLSLCPSHAWSLTKRKKDLSRFLYHTKEHLA